LWMFNIGAKPMGLEGFPSGCALGSLGPKRLHGVHPAGLPDRHAGRRQGHRARDEGDSEGACQTRGSMPSRTSVFRRSRSRRKASLISGYLFPRI